MCSILYTITMALLYVITFPDNALLYKAHHALTKLHSLCYVRIVYPGTTEQHTYKHVWWTNGVNSNTLYSSRHIYIIEFFFKQFLHCSVTT